MNLHRQNHLLFVALYADHLKNQKIVLLQNLF
jgi:hypothetical protein